MNIQTRSKTKSNTSSAMKPKKKRKFSIEKQIEESKDNLRNIPQQLDNIFEELSDNENNNIEIDLPPLQGNLDDNV